MNYFQCAILSPAIRVRDFAVSDIQNYPVTLKCTGGEVPYELEVFPMYYQVPYTRQAVVVRNQAFEAELSYSTPTHYPEQFIG